MRTYKDIHLPFAFNSFGQFLIIYSMHAHFFSIQDFSLMEIVDLSNQGIKRFTKHLIASMP